MKRVFRRPSPAMVVAIVALIVALGGSALAGGILNKKKVKNIANNAITQRAPSLSVANAKGADNAKHADAATSADSAKRADNLMAAKVAANGTLLFAAQDGTSVEPYSAGSGNYFVTFPRDISNCAIVVGGQSGAAQINAHQFGAANRVAVNSSNSAGTSAADAPFSLLVLC